MDGHVESNMCFNFPLYGPAVFSASRRLDFGLGLEGDLIVSTQTDQPGCDDVSFILALGFSLDGLSFHCTIFADR